MKVGSQFSSTDLAVNPARVTPAAKGCYWEFSWKMRGQAKRKWTYAGATHVIFVTDMNVLDSNLYIVHDLGDEGGYKALGLSLG